MRKYLGRSRTCQWFSRNQIWFASAAIIITGNCAATAFWETVSTWVGKGAAGAFSPAGFFFIILFLLVAVWFVKIARVPFWPIAEVLYDDQIPPRKLLVLFLSALSPGLADAGGIPLLVQALSGDLDTDLADLETLKKRCLPKKFLSPLSPDLAVAGSIPSLLRPLSGGLNMVLTHLQILKEHGLPNWPWEMPLRAIKKHLDKLETVILICSWESLIQVHFFLDLCRHYPVLANRRFMLLLLKGEEARLFDTASQFSLTNFPALDFENFAELFQSFSDLFQQVADLGYHEKDVMIDLTGGQKPNSVVAALFTFNRKIKAQYIQTNHPWKVISYDISLLFPDRGGF